MRNVLKMRMHCRINVVFRSNYENFSGTCVNLGMHGLYIGYDGDTIDPGEDVEVIFLVSGGGAGRAMAHSANVKV